MSLVYLQQGNVKKSKNLMTVVNIDKENLHIFQTARGTSMKFSGKMCLIIMLKVTKNLGFALSLEYTLLEIHMGGQFDPLSVFLGLRSNTFSIGQ